MSDWQVGDLAVCVNTGVQHTMFVHIGTGLRLGAVYRVEAIGAPSMAGLPTLILSDVGRKFANRFRKIRPDEHEACETEFVTLLKRSKQTVTATASDWLLRAADQVRQWRKEDENNGIRW